MVGRGWPRTEPPPGACSSFPGALAAGRPRVHSARREGVLNAPPPAAGEEDAAVVRSEPARGPRPSSRAACNMGRPGRGSHAREPESGIQAGRTAAEITAGTRRTGLSFPQGRCGQSSFNALATIFQAAFATVMIITRERDVDSGWEIGSYLPKTQTQACLDLRPELVTFIPGSVSQN